MMKTVQSTSKEVYMWCDELGEPPCAIQKISHKKVSLSEVPDCALMEFPIMAEGSMGSYKAGTSFEIVINKQTWPSYDIDTIRRASNGVGIEMISRGQAGRNYEGAPFHIIDGPEDDLDKFLFKGKGYFELDRLLKEYGM